MGKANGHSENITPGTSMDKRVLVVEDDEGLSNLVQKALRRAGFDTQGALTGADAIGRVMDDPDLILLLDQQLPDMTGTELIRTLVERDRQVPFVTMTGYGDEKIAVEMMKLGAKDYLVKGLGLTDFLPAVFDRVFRDLETKRQLALAEVELQRSEERYKQLFNSGNDAVFVHAVGEEGPEQFTEVNDVACKQLGYCREELLKMSPVDIDAEGMSCDRNQALEKLSKTGQCVFEMVHRSKSGDKIPVEISSSVFVREGTRFVLSIARDITARKQAEQSLQDSENRLQQALRMESIGTLAGGIAHDLNNILFPIVGNTEMLLEDIPEDSPLRNNLNEVFNAAMRARELVKQILAFSRQYNHEIKLMRMQPIIKDALKLIRSTIPTSIEIKKTLSHDCRAIKADPTQIHQVVMNLATNAYHAMEDTGGELKVILKEVELGKQDLPSPDMEPGPYACLIVADTGTGIDDNVKEKIFVPYFTTKELDKGTGMGLSVVHGIVKKAGGSIHLDSKFGQGTEFHVYLPVVKSTFEQQEIQSEEPLKRGTEQILLVDDENTIVSLEKQMLERLGYSVVSRTSSLEALEAFRADSAKFDMVITDMAMPNMSGNQLASELINIRPDIPILLCTGFSEGIPAGKAKSMGIKGILMKPIVKKDLSNKIREVLDNKEG